jgi:hypothetical protein
MPTLFSVSSFSGMSLPLEIRELISRLNQELVQLEDKTTEGLDLVRVPLSQFL